MVWCGGRRCGLTTAHCQMQRDRHFAHLLRRFLRRPRGRLTTATVASAPSRLARPCPSTSRRCWEDISTNGAATLP